jgi:hypothetical protein
VCECECVSVCDCVLVSVDWCEMAEDRAVKQDFVSRVMNLRVLSKVGGI